MFFSGTVVASILAVASAVSGAIIPRAEPGIASPAVGSVINPGQAFDFTYNSIADYGVSSYNYTVWLFTDAPSSLAPSTNFGSGHFFGRFSQPNHPGNDYPQNLPPSQLVMPDFSKNPGGFGSGASASNAEVYLVVLEEYANGDGVLGDRLALSSNQLWYNGTAAQ